MLTDTLIRKAKTPVKPKKLTDGRGLFLLCAPSGGQVVALQVPLCRQGKAAVAGDLPRSVAGEGAGDSRGRPQDGGAGHRSFGRSTARKARQSARRRPTTSRRLRASGWRTSRPKWAPSTIRHVEALRGLIFPGYRPPPDHRSDGARASGPAAQDRGAGHGGDGAQGGARLRAGVPLWHRLRPV